MSRIRKTKPVCRLLAVGLSVVLCTLLILSIVAPLPVGCRILSIGTNYPVSADPSWLTGWDHRCNITIDADDIDSDLTWFPITLTLGTSVGIGSDDVSFIFDEVGDNYLKIAVTNSSGTDQLYVEVESWNSTAEEAVLHASSENWTVSSTADTLVYFYYDNAHADNTDYVGVVGEAPITRSTIHTPSDELTHLNGIELPNGDIISAWSYIPTADHNDDYIGASISEDGGLTWGANYTLVDTAGLQDFLPQFLMINSTCWLFYGVQDIDDPNLEATIYYRTSSDNATSWSSATELTEGYLGDDYRVHPFCNPIVKEYSPNIGRIILPCSFVDHQTGYSSSTFLYSDDSGSTWSRGGNITESSEYCEPTVVELSNGDVLAYMRRQNGGLYVYNATSDDGAESWGSVISTGLDNPRAKSKLLKLANDHYIFFWNNASGTTGTPRHPMDVALSTDDCANWGNVTHIETVAEAWSCDGIIQRDNGEIVVFYRDGGTDTAYAASFSENDITGGSGNPIYNVWDDNFVAIHHLIDSTTSAVSDSTSNENHGAKKAANEPTEATGVIGYGQDFELNDDYINLGDMSTAESYPFTFEAWVKTTSSNDYLLVVGDMSTSVGTHRAVLGILEGAPWYDIRAVTPHAEMFGDNINPVDGSPHYIVGVSAASDDHELYTDGAIDDTDSANVTPSVDTTQIGNWYGYHATWGFEDIIDEVRISDTNRTTAWIATTYETGRDDLLDWGGETTPTPEITNTPSSNAFGILEVSGTGNTSIDYFTITNTGNCAVDITIQGTNLTGGDDTWELSADATPGENIYGLMAGLDDADDLFDTVVNLTANAFATNLAEDATQDWGLNLSMPTSLSGFDGNNMTATITLIASEHT